jgi:hypothetical protein
MAAAVIIVEAGGLPVTNLGDHGATPFTVVGNFGIAVTLVDSGGLPVTLLNSDGSLWTDEGEETDSRWLWGSDQFMWGSDRWLWNAGVGGFALSLDFSDADNSGYLALFEDI